MPEKIAILCSDIHLSHSPPLARSGEPDWYEAMARPLQELQDLAGDKLPVLCGGDVFDRWSCPPKLITFAMKMLPPIFSSIMGQHDLPYHSWEQRESSAFWTLVEAGIIELASGWKVDGWVAWRGFQWGEEIEPAKPLIDVVKVCIAHQYVWLHQDSRTKNPILDKPEKDVRVLAGKLKGYDAVLFGDNHRGFLSLSSRPRISRIFNAGTLMRRSVDERDYRPMVGILRQDGYIEPYRLDTSQDVFDSSDSVREADQVMLHLGSFLEELQKLGETGLDFRRAVEIAMEHEQVSRAVRGIVLDALEKSDGNF